MALVLLLAAIGAGLVSVILYKFITIIWKKYGGAKTDNWALVTGSTDGIGKEFALQLAKKGFNIMLVSRNGGKLEATQQMIERQVGGNVKVDRFEFDFAKNDKVNSAGAGGKGAGQQQQQQMERLIASLKEKKISILVNNVGTSHDHPEFFTETSEDTIEGIINVNILNTLRLTRYILPSMIENKNGLILNLGSFSGETPIPLLQTYSASKAFLKTWSMALSAEVSTFGVQVQLLNTYFVVSNMSKFKRPTFLIPTPESYVKAALRIAGQDAFATPFPPHAFLNELMNLIPTSLLTWINLKQMLTVRQIALKKAKRNN